MLWEEERETLSIKESMSSVLMIFIGLFFSGIIYRNSPLIHSWGHLHGRFVRISEFDVEGKERRNLSGSKGLNIHCEINHYEYYRYEAIIYHLEFECSTNHQLYMLFVIYNCRGWSRKHSNPATMGLRTFFGAVKIAVSVHSAGSIRLWTETAPTCRLDGHDPRMWTVYLIKSEDEMGFPLVCKLRRLSFE